jgi:large subunit ribosomal protein L21
MYAIVEIAGHQYKVQKDQKLYVNRLEGKEGSKVSFDKVLLTDNDGKVEIGAPVISGIKVDATIVEHTKADKVLVFKKKRRKGYQKLNGHRQYITLVEITGVGAGTTKKAAPKKEVAGAPRAEAKKAAPKKETVKAEAPKVEAKKAAPKKAAPKADAAKADAPKAEVKKAAPKKAAPKKENDK